MTSVPSSIPVIAILFVFKFVSGVWLTRSGRPYKGLLLTAHKLISLATAAAIGVALYRLWEDIGLSALELGVAVAAGALFLLAILSGGLASTDKLAHPSVVLIHRIVPFLIVIAVAAALYLLA